ncbi:protein cordon-bleu isoform X3 [Oryzias melastigma]|uniref:protein cordon-bleu isoform X3 n=1 Tax=Oryzias melastigma TaxID=30732 RepID=UPI000CF8355E|nr:protein cordon-bleu isoform X3 [Oryzias melastigma]
MTESKPPTGRVMKTRAPPPPPLAPQPAPRHIFRNSVLDGGGPSAIDAKDNTAKPYVDFQLTLPQGHQFSVTEDGSKALMDLLVELCSRHHFNPALYTLELWSPEGLLLPYKPNALLCSLNVACVLIKEKVAEEKVGRRPAPKVPEKTVRLMVNYHVNQKAVVRVNPLVALQTLIPTICSKCELEPSHVLLLKDSVSHHELPLDKSLTELGIKELYVHDQSLDPISSSAASLGAQQKKSLLGILQFGRRKSKDQSSLSGVSTTEDHPGILGKSQSVTYIHTMSPKTETKKRRAPPPPAAPPPTTIHASSEQSQVGLVSESQQKRKKAPPPPPFIFRQNSDISPPPVPQTSNGHSTEAPTPVHRTNVTKSNVTVELRTVEPAPLSQALEPPFVSAATPTPSSPSPSSDSSSNDSLTMQESSSELCHSLDDSDADLDRTGSRCSSSATSNNSAQLHPTTQSSSSKTAESSSSASVVTSKEVNSDSGSKSDTESALNLKLEEVENNRHSAVEDADLPVPPKPPRSSSTEPPQHVPHLTISVPHTYSHVIVSDSETVMSVEAGSHPSWICSMDTSTVSCQRPETEVETLSLASSNGSSSLPDQGYAASEGMAEVEDPSAISFSPDQQSSSINVSLSLEGGGGDKGEKLQRLVQQKNRNNSSDSDEGCATWGSTHRHGVSTTCGQSVHTFEDDPELKSQLHQTLADFEATLADHMNINSAKDSHYTMSTNSNEVPVSVVDIDVPVTAIDDVLQDYEHDIVKHELTSFEGTNRSGKEGSDIHHKSEMETQNKNNNACTTAVSPKRSDSKPSDKHLHDKKEERKKTVGKERTIDDTISKREDKQKIPVKSSTDSKKTEVNPDYFQNNSQKKLDLQPKLPRSLSPVKGEEKHRVSQSHSALSSSQGKITPNVTSRFGLKTFTVVPPKPSVTHAATTESAATLTIGAIKIDDLGNMVTAGISRARVSRSPEPESREVSPLLGQAKAFWSSNERQKNSVTQRKALIDKVKENADDFISATATKVSLEVSDTVDKKTTQSTGLKATDTAQHKVLFEAKEVVTDVGAPNTERTEAESNVSLFKDTQKPTNNPSPPPLVLPDLKRDLSFLKPSRRTSSQYVASAISKYAPKTAAKPSSSSSFPLKTETTDGFYRSGQSIQVNAFQSDNKENVNTSRASSPGPRSSTSCPEDLSKFRKGKLEKERFEKYSGSSKECSDSLNIGTAKSNFTQSSGSTQTRQNVNNSGNYVKEIRSRSPSPGSSNYLLPSSKIPTAPNPAAPDQISSLKENAQLPPSVTVSDCGETTGPPAITVFGPVKRFRPVIHKSVEKETSLHSSLMEAIQTGGGKDRLKKISSEASNLNKGTYTEEGNEKSALLAAIRDHSNSSRLRKTKSGAASELEQIRRSTAAEEKSLASSASSSCVPTPPPPPMPAVPPPPPPVLLQRKPSSVAHAGTPMDPAMAREAMLEAIRSGSAAGKLKKVAVPTKTFNVNARLGTIQAANTR